MSDTNENKKPLNSYTREELLALRHRDWDKESTYDSILLLQSDELHASGYRNMIIIGVAEYTPVEIVSDYCDDLKWLMPHATYIGSIYPIRQMRMDCLATSKAFHPWSRESKFKVGNSLPSITIEVVRSK